MPLFLVINNAAGYGDLKSAVIRAGGGEEAVSLFVEKATEYGAPPMNVLVTHRIVADGTPGVVHEHVPT